MNRWLFEGVVLSGAALMVCNIICFIRYSRFVYSQKSWRRSPVLLWIPNVLLIMFLMRYLLIGLFGDPDYIVAGILFGGSVFVFIMYLLLSRITQQIIEGEQKEIEQAAAVESHLAKDRFLASVSHEMRTPLNVILGLNSAVQRTDGLRPETQGQLKKIELSARHLLGIINNMLDISLRNTDRLVLRNADFSLNAALDQLNAIATTLCEEKGLQYELNQPETMEYILFGDEAELKQVLLNILSNAVKFTEPPGVILFSIEVFPLDDARRSLRFTIADTGIGISEDFLPKLFTPFSQEDDGSTNRYGGSGLSLAAAKSIVDLMGGEIRVESEKGRGSIFKVTVPMQCVREIRKSSTPDPEKDRAGKSAEAPLDGDGRKETEVSLAGKRVLIVDDIKENAEIVEDLLSIEDVETEIAGNGKIAVEMVEGHPAWYYDAILMDLRMPVMDGLEATRQIRSLDRPDAGRVPIIAISANAFEHDVDASLRAGMNAHVAKPADADHLYETLKQRIAAAADT